MYTFEVFGKAAVIAWPGTTSEQAGGERAGKPVRFEAEDAEWVKAQSPLIRRVTRETVRFQGVSYGERLSDCAVRGVFPEYGEMRNEIPSDGRWISPEDVAERRRVIFLGASLRKKLFSGEPALGEIVRIKGVPFTVIGAMTLGIGGVGVMNIMLVSVEERVREIGLRRALGARKKHIRWQFLLEALVMTLAAGAIGMLLSWGLTTAIGTLPFLGPAYEDESGKVDIHLTLSFMTMFLSSAILIIVGVISGWLPAMQAAKLDPVEALRYE